MKGKIRVLKNNKDSKIVLFNKEIQGFCMQNQIKITFGEDCDDVTLAELKIL